MCDAGRVVLRRWIIGLLGLATLACYTNRYPLVAVALAVPATPRAAKLFTALGSLGALLIVDVAALAAGSLFARRLGPLTGADDLAVPVQLSLGLVTLA
jgi:hypothetical protein